MENIFVVDFFFNYLCHFDLPFMGCISQNYGKKQFSDENIAQ